MPAIVYHIGIFNKRDEMEYVKYVIKSQMTILHACCKAADIYLGLHADAEQATWILGLADEIGLKITDVRTYQDDLWEVPTVEWLQSTIAPKYAQDDYISYVHSKGITHHDDKTRDYIMDHLFVQYDDNLSFLKTCPKMKSAVCFARVDLTFEAPSFWMSCWTATIDHVMSIPAPNRDMGRYGSEAFLQIKLGEFWPIDNRMCVHKPEAVDIMITVPFQYTNGDAWKPSETLQKLLKPLQRECDVVTTYKMPGSTTASRASNDDGSPTPKTLHIIYGSVIGTLLLVGLIYVWFQNRKRNRSR